MKVFISIIILIMTLMPTWALNPPITTLNQKYPQLVLKPWHNPQKGAKTGKWKCPKHGIVPVYVCSLKGHCEDSGLSEHFNSRLGCKKCLQEEFNNKLKELIEKDKKKLQDKKQTKTSTSNKGGSNNANNQ